VAEGGAHEQAVRQAAGRRGGPAGDEGKSGDGRVPPRRPRLPPAAAVVVLLLLVVVVVAAAGIVMLSVLTART
jgi:hypothetical protein